MSRETGTPWTQDAGPGGTLRAVREADLGGDGPPSLDAACAPGTVGAPTCSGSSTGTNALGANQDGTVGCMEAAAGQTSVRGCLETACECSIVSDPEQLAP